jgi:N-acetyl-1-D-myo-inositol-2-amino-2-deoxy-alpha-D-glucopyranoside deacetylase
MEARMRNRRAGPDPAAAAVTRSLTAVFAHPDDESVTCGATLARYSSEGVRTSVVLATKGEIGEIASPDMATPETLGEIREAETERALEVLGVGALHFLGYRDGEVDRADREEVIEKLLEIFAAERPDAVITFGSVGYYEHPDHARIGELTTEAFHRYRSDSPDARLYYPALPRELLRQAMKLVEGRGLGSFEIDPDKFGVPDEQITTRLDTSAYAARKLDALLAHRTQMANTPFAQGPRDLLETFFASEFYVRAWPEPSAGKPGPGEEETGLFE